MKKLLALLLVGMMIFSLAACGENETPSGSEGDNPGTSQTDNQGSENNNGGEENSGGESIYDIEGQFSAKQIAFIESLGKSEEGKRFVAFNEENGYVEFYVAEWNDATTLKNLTHYTVYFTNASFTASERYQEAMDDYQKKWNMCESLGTDPSTILANYKEKSEELCMTAEDKTDSFVGQQIVTFETHDDIARRLYDGATLVE